MDSGGIPRILSCSRMVVLSLAMAVVSAPAAQPDSSTTRQDQIHFDRLVYAAAGAAALNWTGFRYLERNWWQGSDVPFRLVHDWSGDTNLNLDQAGHFMGGVFLAQAASDLYSWIGFAPRTALLLGSMSSLTELLYIEYRDGRSDQWGFSTPDAAADVLGALFPLIHSYIPATRPIHFKYGYFPSPLYRHRNLRRVSGRPFVPSFIDDYEGMTFWMVMNPAPRLKEHGTAIWPAWLGLAVGVGAQGLHGFTRDSRGPDRAYPELPDAQRELYLSLDFDYAHFLGKVTVLRKFTPYLRLRRFPGPALRLHPTRTFYWILF